MDIRIFTEVQAPGCLDSVFSCAPPLIEVEIGCGNGHFLAAYASEHPECFFIGIDIKRGRCAKALRKQNKIHKNTVIIAERAEKCLNRIPPDSVDRFHIYFPDPWPKTKHRKRRFFRKGNLDLLFRLLKRGGSLLFACDMLDYYIQAKVLVSLHSGFKIDEDSPAEAMFDSMFSQRFLRSGKSIYFFCAVKS